MARDGRFDCGRARQPAYTHRPDHARFVRTRGYPVDVFAAIVCGVIAWHAYRLLREEITWGDTIFGNTPLWIMHVIVPLAFALISYQFAVRVAGLVRGLIVGGDEAGEDEETAR